MAEIEDGKDLVKTHRNTAKVQCRWAIGLLFTDGLMFVTGTERHSKYFYWESGKSPLYFESKRTADDYAFGMAVNGYPAVVIEIPDGFTIRNPIKEANDNES